MLRGYTAGMLPIPSPTRAIAFFDGQNLFHCARTAFGHNFPNYDPVALANKVCATKGWRCDGVRFYTGVPDAGDNPFWNHFWVAKESFLGSKRSPDGPRRRARLYPPAAIPQ